MFLCKICNYNTDKKQCIEKHIESNKHNKNIKTNTHCYLCNKNFSNNSNYRKHYKSLHLIETNIHIKNMTLNQDIDIYHNIYYDANYHKKIDEINIKNNQINQTNSDIIINKIENTGEEIKEEIKEVKIIVKKALTKAASLIKYLMENYKSVPPLKKLKSDQCIKLLQIEYNCDKDKDQDHNKNYNKNIDDYNLEKELIYDYSKNRFIEKISKIILNLVNHDDPNKQQIWNTDFARLHYIIKISLDKWTEDKCGIKFTDLVIKPFLNSICEKIRNYRMNEIDKIDIKKYTLEQNINHNNILTNVYGFECALMRNEFIKPILRELAPHLRYVQKELEQLDEMDKLGISQDDIDLVEEIDNFEMFQEELKKLKDLSD